MDRDDVEYSDSIASFPFFENWEGGTTFDPWWEVVPGAEGRIEVTSGNGPYQGNYHVTLDDTTDGSADSLNQLILHINLAGQTGVRLQFANKEFSDEDNPEDSVDVSVDGGATWHPVVALTGTNSTDIYTERSYDLDSLGLTYSADTLIRFQQFDNYAIPTDGMAFDNIRVDAAPVLVDFYSADLSTEPGWSTAGEWAFGVPAGLGGTAHGGPDPTSGATGTNVYGVDLNGDYNLTIGGPFYLTTTAIDCSDHENVSLKFQRWLNTDYPAYAYATIDVSNNGTTWTNVFTNPTSEIADSAWQSVQYDISSVADNEATVYIRWGYQVASGAFAYSGWNIDDVALSRTPVDGPPVVTVNALVTNDSTPALTGTVDDPTATISVTVGSQVGLAATNNGDGTWTLPDNTLAALANGTYNVVVTATDAALNVGTDATTNELTILVLPGDYNQNDVVDAADYVFWRKTLGTTGIQAYSGADGSGNGSIGEEDHGVWRANFGNVPPLGAGSGTTGQVATADGGEGNEESVSKLLVGMVGQEVVPHGESQAATSGTRAESGEFGTANLRHRDEPLRHTTGTRDLALRIEARKFETGPVSERLAPRLTFAVNSSAFSGASRPGIISRQAADATVEGVQQDDALVAWLASRGMKIERDGFETVPLARNGFVDDTVKDSLAAFDAVFETTDCGVGVMTDSR
jgi:hypothetical protein